LKELNRSRDLDGTARAVVRYAISQIPGAQVGALFLLDDAGNYRPWGATGWDSRDVVIPGDVFPAFDRPKVLRGRERGPLSDLGVAVLIAPIRGGDARSYLALAGPDIPEQLSPSSLERLQSVWGEVVCALERAREWEDLSQTGALFRLLFERLADAVFIISFDGTILDANPAASEQTGYSRDELIGMNIIHDLAVGRPSVPVEELKERLARGERVIFEERKRRKDGTIYWTECAAVRFEYHGHVATLSVNREITERKRLEEALQRHIKELEALNSALRSMVSALETEEVLRRLVTLTGELVGAEYVVIAVFDEDGNLKRIIDRPMGIGPLPTRIRTKGLTRKILATGMPVLVGEVKSDGSTIPAIQDLDGTTVTANPVVVEAGVKSFASVPIKYKDRVTGILSVFSRAPHAFDDRLPVLSSLADAAAVAVENARLYEEARYLFEESPVSLWVEDFSPIKQHLDALKEQGVTDFRAYIRDHPELVEECVRLLRVVEVNRTTLRLYKVRDFRELLERMPAIITPEVKPLLEEELLAIWNGKQEFEGIGLNRTAAGEPIHIHLRWRVFPGYEHDYSRVLVSILDITDRVEMEEKLRTYVDKLAALHRAVWDLQRCRTVEEVCRTAVEGAHRILGFSICNIGLVEGDMIVPVVTVGEIRARPFKRGEGLVWKTLEKQRSFWGELGEIPGAKPVDARLKSVISVPIGDLGVFQAASFEPGAFTEDDVRLVEILAGHVGEEIRRVRLEEQLREQAIRDPLTGLYNRRHLMEILEQEVRRAREEEYSFVVLVADLNNFKRINDRYGHPFGDEVLKEVADIFRKTLRESDLIFRYGGDEFVLLFPEVDGSALEVAQKVKEAVARWVEERGLDSLEIGISLGMAVWRPEAPLSPEELLRRADRDLYRSKRPS